MSVTKVTGMMQTGTKGGDIPSAGTLVIDTDGDYFDITGTTGITAMTVAAGRIFTLQFDGVVTLTHGSTLYLNGAVNFTTEAFDHLTFIAVAANDVRQIGAGLKDGGSPVAAATTDLTPVRQDIAMLALYNAVSDNREAYNLPFSFVDQFEDDTGVTTQTDVSNVSEYFASIYTAVGQFTSDSNTSLLVHFDTDPITDSSSHTHTITATSPAARVSTASKFGGYSGKTGTGYWTIPSSSEFAFGTGDFTIEFWVNIVTWAVNADKQIFSGPGSGMGINIGVGSASSYQPYFHVPGDYPPNLGGWSGLSHTGDGASGGWYHYAYSRASGTSWAHSNGVRTATDTDGSTHNYTAELKYIGKYGGGQQWDFWIDELRVSKGIARYGSADFTPNEVSATNATGTLISDQQTAPALTKMSGVVLVKDGGSSATVMGTHLKIYFCATGAAASFPSAWVEAASYTAVTAPFSTGVTMYQLGETTVPSGTLPTIRAVWASQTSGGFESQLHGWAMNY